MTVEKNYVEKYVFAWPVLNAGRLPVFGKVARQNVATCPN